MAAARRLLALLAAIGAGARGERLSAISPHTGGYDEAGELAAAAAQVEALPEFQHAESVRVDRDVSQAQVRLAVLRAGKKLLVPQPALQQGVLSLLDPTKIDPDRYAEAVTEEGIQEFGRPIDVDTKIKVGLVVVGSMAVNPSTGARCGKDLRFANLEYGMLRQMEAIEDETPLVTAVRELQLADKLPEDGAMCDDVPVDIICTPTRTLRMEKSLEKPEGIKWEKIHLHTESIQLLRKLRSKSKAEGLQVEARDRAAWKLAIHDNIEKRMKAEKEHVGREFSVAAAMVEQLPEFAAASWVRVPRGLAQHHIRLAVLQAGKRLLVPQPELKTPHLVLLDPSKIAPREFANAVTEGGMQKFGHPVSMDGKATIDLFVMGSVAVNPATGARLGPRGGLEDLEYGMLRQMGAVDDSTTVVTTVRDLQLVDDIPSDPALCDDVPVDVICTPSRLVRVDAPLAKPAGINWEKLSPMAESQKLQRKSNDKSQAKTRRDARKGAAPA